MDGSDWWKETVKVRNGFNVEVGRWFQNNIRREVRNRVIYIF